MRKVICDFCKKETMYPSTYSLPVLHDYDVKDENGNIIYRLDGCEEKEKDVCPECERKIASLLELVPNVKFENNDKTSMSISW